MKIWNLRKKNAALGTIADPIRRRWSGHTIRYTMTAAPRRSCLVKILIARLRMAAEAKGSGESLQARENRANRTQLAPLPSLKPDPPSEPYRSNAVWTEPAASTIDERGEVGVFVGEEVVQVGAQILAQETSAKTASFERGVCKSEIHDKDRVIRLEKGWMKRQTEVIGDREIKFNADCCCCNLIWKWSLWILAHRLWISKRESLSSPPLKLHSILDTIFHLKPQ